MCARPGHGQRTWRYASTRPAERRGRCRRGFLFRNRPPPPPPRDHFYNHNPTTPQRPLSDAPSGRRRGRPIRRASIRPLDVSNLNSPCHYFVFPRIQRSMQRLLCQPADGRDCRTETTEDRSLSPQPSNAIVVKPNCAPFLSLVIVLCTYVWPSLCALLEGRSVRSTHCSLRDSCGGRE